MSSGHLNLSALSPRVRGNFRGLLSLGVVLGSIPTCAGKPVFSAITPARQSVYPHVRGETRALGLNEQLDLGLSPRARGNHHRRCGGQFLKGSIPTCAGKPEEAKDIRERLKVYPHVRGETMQRAYEELMPEGLSPRARGNQKPVFQGMQLIGSIPTCAGKP